MFQKLDEIEKRYEELQQKAADPAIGSDLKAWRASTKLFLAIHGLTL